MIYSAETGKEKRSTAFSHAPINVALGFQANPLELATGCFHIHKFSIRTSLDVKSCFGVKHLAALFDSTDTPAVSIRFVFRHNNYESAASGRGSTTILKP